MTDDVLLNKAAIIERCVQRARDEYEKDTTPFATDITRQDAAILNIQRACEAALDMGTHLIRRERLGIPQSARHVFDLLAQAEQLDSAQAAILKNMVGFRNIAVHEYQKVQLPIVVSIITRHLEELLSYSATLLKQGNATPSQARHRYPPLASNAYSTTTPNTLAEYCPAIQARPVAAAKALTLTNAPKAKGWRCLRSRI